MQMALAASGEVSALILSGALEDYVPERSREFLRQRSLIASSLEG
jgi:hypothetical protein